MAAGTHWSLRRVVGSSLLTLALFAGSCSDAAPELEVSLALDWSMPDRFGRDADADGLPDVPNTFEYVHGLDPGACDDGCDSAPGAFEVRLAVTITPWPEARAVRYRWEVAGGELGEPVVIETGEPAASLALPEGEYQVRVEASGGGVVPAAATAVVTVDDVLIVALGDSFASGEGNPERPIGGDESVATWADDGSGTQSTVWEAHQRAHRSTLAAAAQAALELERADPRSSVTFVFLAASGASVEEGLLGPHPGVDREELWPDRADLPPQIDEVARLLGCREDAGCDRTVDALILSIGGNDAGWARLQGELVALENLGLAGFYEALVDLAFDRAERDIGALPGLLERADAAIAARFETDRILLVGYPSPIRGYETVGAERFPICDGVLGGIIPFLEIDAVELALAEKRFADPLNDTLRNAASTLGWDFVESHGDGFRGHGYCGTDPYDSAAFSGNPYPGNVEIPDDPGVRWFRQADESVAIQGAPGAGTFTPEELATRGANHPNEYGHRAIAEALLDALAGGS